jgi:hypothetical protein
MASSQLTRVLIDSSSGLNLLFASTLKKIGLDISKMLTPSRAPFYGIILGNAATPLGSVVLPVTFGMKHNYCTEYIKFEVAFIESPYHAIYHTLKYLILGCEYLSECFHLSIGISKNFLEFFWQLFSFILELDLFF